VLGVRPLVDAALPARLVPEVLDEVRDVDLAAVDARLLERAVEEGAGRPDERDALAILAVPGLLADEDRPRTRRALAGNRLDRISPELAGPAILDRRAELGERRALGNGGGRQDFLPAIARCSWSLFIDERPSIPRFLASA
jgi:hypothetical protein